MNVDEDERRSKRVIQRIDGIDQMFTRLLHEPDDFGSRGRKALRERWITQALSDPWKKFPNLRGGRQVGLYISFPALRLTTKIDVIVKDLGFLGRRQVADIDNGSLVDEYGQIALAESDLGGFVDVKARR